MHRLEFNTSQFGVNITTRFKNPFPFYPLSMREADGEIFVILKSGHYINLTIQMQIIGDPVSG